ncbi:MJ0042-type zinc finger domain-containing protein, partial [Vibrio vulnificus]|uniref:MJ0042-type zinc finger domain-containing protein n=1 Tax=Vibrio vulnificus TaxID=672 RepID=UPI0039B69A0F
ATVFRLDTVQLRAREGRVRCGRCHTVFDAVDAMVELPLPRGAGGSTPADSSPSADAPHPEHSHATLSVLAAPAIETPAQSPADIITD